MRFESASDWQIAGSIQVPRSRCRCTMNAFSGYEATIDQRLAELLEFNSINPENAHKCVFCLCSFCHFETLLLRRDMCCKSTPYKRSHSSHIPLASTHALFPHRKCLSLETYLEYYLDHLRGVRSVEGGLIAHP